MLSGGPPENPLQNMIYWTVCGPHGIIEEGKYWRRFSHVSGGKEGIVESDSLERGEGFTYENESF